MTRKAIERRLRALTKKRFEYRHAGVARRIQLDELGSEIRDLQDRLVDVVGAVEIPNPPPTCWCCSCRHQSVKHDGCRMCWMRDDVQAWIDARGPNGKMLMTEDHGTGFGCPISGRSPCPGWEPRNETSTK